MYWARRPPFWGFVAALLAFSWQTLTVHYNYAGNWTALYCTGVRAKAPPVALDSEHIHLFPNFGYDGQAYHYVAHDPLLQRGFQRSIDSPRFRYRRILVPLAAWLLAGAQDRFVDIAYASVVLLFVFLGGWWVGSIAQQQGAHPAWSLAFLLLPAVTTSLDRLTVDVALASLTAGVVLYAHRQDWRTLFVLCAMAPLTRESGVLLTLGIVAWCVSEHRFKRAFVLSLSLIPTIGWYAYVNSRTAGAPVELFSPIPFGGIIQRLQTPYPYPFTFGVNVAATILDYAALSGVLLGVIYVAVYARALATRPEGFTAFAFVALVAFVSTPAVWVEVYAFARGFSPLILLVGLDGFRTRSALAVLPLALTAPRVGLQIGSQILNVGRGLLGL